MGTLPSSILNDSDPFAFLDGEPDPLKDTVPQSVARIVDKVTREAVAAKDGIATHTEKCPKCRGARVFYSYSGRSLGPCFKCKGKGTLTFATSKAERTQAKVSRVERKARDAESNLESFAQSFATESDWVQKNASKQEPFAFAVAMRDAVKKYGTLTDNQLAAIRKCIMRETARTEERVQRESNAKEIDASALEAAFAKASESLQWPKFSCGPFRVSKASAESKNAGSLYVKGNGGVYLGKISSGKFFPSRECTADLESEFRTLAADPKQAAIAHGKLTGSCACCGRALTNKESIELGIGPICASKWF